MANADVGFLYGKADLELIQTLSSCRRTESFVPY